VAAGHTVGGAVGLGYVENKGEVVKASFIKEGSYEIE
jgi:hypothetical protein